MQVMSVTGPLDASDLGVVLPHEHVFADLVREYRGTGLLNDEHLARQELALLREVGGQTLVDLTLDEIGRDPAALRRVAEATGVTIVMGCGHYRDPYLNRDWFDRHTVNAIADQIVADVEEGVNGAGIRAGIIGEIGADKRYISAAEERSFRAAAADTVPIPDYHLSPARLGCYVCFDSIGTGTSYDLGRAVGYVMALVRAGFSGQVLLSHDIFLRGHLHADGGPGYAYLLTEFLPLLVEAGLDAEEARSMVTTNPQQALAGVALPAAEHRSRSAATGRCLAPTRCGCCTWPSIAVGYLGGTRSAQRRAVPARRAT